MGSMPPGDALGELIGTEVPSDLAPGVVYRIVSRVGEGAMSVAFLALRRGPEGETPVVIKVLRPWFVEKAGPTAGLIVKKESVALGRLNERVPPTPFVVRLIDTGSLARSERAGGARARSGALALPWIVLEYVHGGAEGTTLTERVAHSLRCTGAAFDPLRAAHAVECLASGLMAVHEVGVIHRDLKPDNVLCCGFDDDEIFKIADFGVARPAGVAGTFGGMVVGTLGYAAPELATLDQASIGPWSDVFSLGCVAYFLLTGEDLFDVSSPAAAIIAAVDPARRSITDARGLAPELRANEQACRAIDFGIACATSGKTEVRPHRADAFAAMLVPWLSQQPARHSLAARRLDRGREHDDDATELVGWSWTAQRAPAGMVVRSAAWDGDGRCMAATSRGLAFWTGAGWTDVPLRGFPRPDDLRFVRRIGAGRWLVGSGDGALATVTSEGTGEVRSLPGRGMRFELMSGELEDLAVLLGSTPDGTPVLCTMTSGRWLKPLPLADVAAVTGLARVEDARWLVAGRDREGKGFAGLYSPLDWEIVRLPTPDVRVFLGCAGQWHRRVGLATGAEGAVVWWRGGRVTCETIATGADLSAAGVDAAGRGWAASAGRIWLHRTVDGAPGAMAPPDAEGGATTQGEAGTPGRWDAIFTDPAATAPIVSLFTDLGVVIAMAADGGILDGRAQGGEDRDPPTQRFRAI